MRAFGKIISVLVLTVFVISTLTVTAGAAVRYMPDVTPEMSKVSYWTDKMNDTDKILAGPEDITGINKSIVDGDGTGVVDLDDWSQNNMTFDGREMAQRLYSSAMADAETFYSWGAVYDKNGTGYSGWNDVYEHVYKPMVDNTIDPGATTNMNSQFAICVKRTNLLAFPADNPLLEDPTDPDNGDLYLSMVRVNEPMVIQAKSADGQYYSARTSCTSGWINKDDIAICADRDQWLAAWDFGPDKTLVVYDDKIYTEESKYTPELSSVKLPMGTCLELASEDDIYGFINKRTAHNNHVVWMPVRKSDGTYEKKLCLIGENRKVSEGFLPLTTSNLVMVAMNQLGDIYGWGGQMGSEDCSGYVRDVYKCFGLELARNTTLQMNQPVKRWNLSNKTDAQKIEIIKRLPAGAVLFFSGHEMIYLGEDNGKLYVISSLGKIVLDGDVTAVRGGIINTLDMKRSNGATWLRSITQAQIPYLPAGAKKDLSNSDITITVPDTPVYNGQAQTPEVIVNDNAGTLVKDEEYTVSYNKNTNAGTAKVTITAAEGSADYTGSGTGEFQIEPASLTGATVSGISDAAYTGKPIEPDPIVKLSGVTLKEGKDYTVSYSNNIEIGTADVNIVGKGNYKGTRTTSFRIGQATLEDAVISKIPDMTYTGKDIEPDPVVKLSGTTLAEGQDYEVSYSENVNAGTAKVTVEGKGDYVGTVSADFTIKPANLSDASVSDIPDKTYTGKAFEPAPEVDMDGNVLEKDKDYSTMYVNNKNAGIALVIMMGEGNYTGISIKPFVINKAANPLSVKGKTATVKYKKLKKKAQTIPASKAYKFTNKGKGTLTYTRSSGNKKITVNKKNGKITVKKGLKKNTYNMKVKVKAAGNGNYKAKTTTVTVKIRVK